MVTNNGCFGYFTQRSSQITSQVHIFLARIQGFIENKEFSPEKLVLFGTFRMIPCLQKKWSLSTLNLSSTNPRIQGSNFKKSHVKKFYSFLTFCRLINQILDIPTIKFFRTIQFQMYTWRPLQNSFPFFLLLSKGCLIQQHNNLTFTKRTFFHFQILKKLITQIF